MGQMLHYVGALILFSIMPRNPILNSDVIVRAPTLGLVCCSYHQSLCQEFVERRDAILEKYKDRERARRAYRARNIGA